MVPGKAPKGPQILPTDLLSLPLVSIIWWLISYRQKRVDLNPIGHGVQISSSARGEVDSTSPWKSHLHPFFGQKNEIP